MSDQVKLHPIGKLFDIRINDALISVYVDEVGKIVLGGYGWMESYEYNLRDKGGEKQDE